MAAASNKESYGLGLHDVPENHLLVDSAEKSFVEDIGDLPVVRFLNPYACCDSF